MKIYFGRDSFGSAELHIVTHRHTKVVSPYGAAPPLHRAGFRPVLGTPRYGLLGASIKGSQDVVSQPTRLQSKPTYARPDPSVGVSICSSGGFLAYCVQYFGAGTAYKTMDGTTAKAAPDMISAALTTTPSCYIGTSLSAVRCKILLYSCGGEVYSPASLFVGECQDPKPRICY